MRILPVCIAATLAVFTISTTQATDPYQLDQRNPAYQKSMEHLAQASQALAIAKLELSKAQAAYQLPGLNTQQMQDQLRPLEDTLAVLISPEKKRMAHQTVVPDGLFFTPLSSGE